MAVSKDQIKQVMSAMGKKGRGKSKVRGNAEYYKNIVKIREEKRRLKASASQAAILKDGTYDKQTKEK